MKYYIILRVYALICGLFLASCGSDKKPKHSSTPDDLLSALKVKYSNYYEWNSNYQDAYGFILYDTCDSLLFSGLLGIVKPVDLLAARDNTDRWYRRPLSYERCYPGSSKSTISRDMLTGVLWWIWRNKRLDVAQDLFEYGKSTDWIMGDGDISRIYFTPALQSTLAEMIYRLGGDNKIVYRSIPQVNTQNVNFAAHLDMLHILLRAEMIGSIEANALTIVKYNYKRSPKNAFYSYVYHKYTDGNQQETIGILLDELVFPSMQLPSTANYCTEWRWQRDPGSDWEPCLEAEKTHSGSDFLFVAKLVLGD